MYVGKNLEASSREYPNAICVKSLVPKEKKSAFSAIKSAISKEAKAYLREIELAGDDCIFLVSNAIEGAVFIKAMADINMKTSVIS